MNVTRQRQPQPVVSFSPAMVRHSGQMDGFNQSWDVSKRKVPCVQMDTTAAHELKGITRVRSEVLLADGM